MNSTTARVNRYAGPCVNCTAHVPAGEGTIERISGGRWVIQHAECPTVPTAQGRHALPYSEDAAAIAHRVGYRGRHAARELSPAGHAAPVIPVPDVPAEALEGYYTRNGEAFRVVLNKAKTHTYAKRLVQYGDRLSWDYAPGVGRDLAAEGLIPMTATEAGRLGLLHGRCINCLRPLGGESLSAQVSALIGYGETCARRHSWEYPTGAAAQRAYIAAQG